jgi:hypothetical protein
MTASIDSILALTGLVTERPYAYPMVSIEPSKNSTAVLIAEAPMGTWRVAAASCYATAEAALAIHAELSKAEVHRCAYPPESEPWLQAEALFLGGKYTLYSDKDPIMYLIRSKMSFLERSMKDCERGADILSDKLNFTTNPDTFRTSSNKYYASCEALPDYIHTAATAIARKLMNVSPVDFVLPAV